MATTDEKKRGKKQATRGYVRWSTPILILGTPTISLEGIQTTILFIERTLRNALDWLLLWCHTQQYMNTDSQHIADNNKA
mmetsp:Transcript_16948/g.48996  ORF Transcript_16948/g.48996 Transcript_16948/m.48996 type:complete len:80 (-) Transcript_16948:26-265(-)